MVCVLTSTLPPITTRSSPWILRCRRLREEHRRSRSTPSSSTSSSSSSTPVYSILALCLGSLPVSTLVLSLVATAKFMQISIYIIPTYPENIEMDMTDLCSVNGDWTASVRQDQFCW
ncbi:hypothetical protein VNO77_28396 [Canavalia gladiata]|uniref:Uncharacterized protein n=1 Tax=Canavalia gladiata TaxID=3824 RepID=A0AAN9KWQ2_CANGL